MHLGIEILRYTVLDHNYTKLHTFVSYMTIKVRFELLRLWEYNTDNDRCRCISCLVGDKNK